ncbi:MAG TPA: hypothetical protein VGI39_04910 [Polyangiaceae bacterium]
MGRPTQVPEESPLTPLLAHAGGVLALAEATSISRRTILRVGADEVEPSALVRRALNDYARAAKLRLPFPDRKTA